MPSTILIADDYDDNRELLRLMLAADGYRVREARDGRECVAEARAEAPDLALIDLSMPHLDGWGALEELRADPQTRAIPCVAVTAFAAEQDRRRALAAGFDAYISKPFRSRDLLELVARLLDGGRDGQRPGGADTHGAAHDAPAGRDGNRS
jgi:CheY-like chemotaxis protein